MYMCVCVYVTSCLRCLYIYGNGLGKEYIFYIVGRVDIRFIFLGEVDRLVVLFNGRKLLKS